MRYKRDFESEKQEFSEYEPDYYLDAEGHLKELPSPKNVQEEIESHRESCLSSILDKYLEDGSFSNGVVFDDGVSELVMAETDLDVFLKADAICDRVRASTGNSSLTRNQVLKYLNEKRAEAFESLKKGEKHEEAHEEENKQEKLSPDGEQSQQ